MNSEIPLVYKSDLSFPAKHSAHWNSHLGFLFPRSSHYPLPILPIKGHESGTKVPAEGYTTDTVLKIRWGINSNFIWEREKSTFFKTIKSHLLELETPLVTHTYSIFREVSRLVFAHGLCTRDSLLWDRHSPWASLHSPNSIDMNTGWGLLGSQGGIIYWNWWGTRISFQHWLPPDIWPKHFCDEQNECSPDYKCYRWLSPFAQEAIQMVLEFCC